MQTDGIISLYLAIFEFSLLTFLLLLRKKHASANAAMLMLFFLAGYQLCETLMCKFGLTGHILPYLAITDISLLPPITLIFSLHFWGSKSFIPYLFLIPVTFFAVFYAIHLDAMVVAQCTPFYAMFHYPLGDLYGAFYYAPIMISMIIFIVKIKKEGNGKLRSMGIVILSVFIFISIPVVTAFVSRAAGYPELLKAVESIMCKSAGVLAMAITYVSYRLSDE